MTRLTDVDALAKEFDEKCGNECGCCKYAVAKIVLVGHTKCRIFERCGLIANAPTIDAIPVEWLRGQMARCHENSAMYQTANTLLQLWLEEQESESSALN